MPSQGEAQACTQADRLRQASQARSAPFAASAQPGLRPLADARSLAQTFGGAVIVRSAFTVGARHAVVLLSMQRTTCSHSLPLSFNPHWPMTVSRSSPRAMRIAAMSRSSRRFPRKCLTFTGTQTPSISMRRSGGSANANATAQPARRNVKAPERSAGLGGEVAPLVRQIPRPLSAPAFDVADAAVGKSFAERNHMLAGDPHAHGLLPRRAGGLTRLTPAFAVAGSSEVIAW
jgi:hypothetical protein